MPGVSIDAPDTNIVMVDLPARLTADTVVGAAAAQGVRLSAFGPRRLRAVTHLDVSREDVLRAGVLLARVMEG